MTRRIRTIYFLNTVEVYWFSDTTGRKVCAFHATYTYVQKSIIADFNLWSGVRIRLFTIMRPFNYFSDVVTKRAHVHNNNNNTPPRNNPLFPPFPVSVLRRHDTILI